MGLATLALAALCLNATCPEEDYLNISENARKTFLQKLADELMGENLVVTTLDNDRLSGFRQTRNGSYIGTGVAFDLLDIIRRKYKFRYTVVPAEENAWASSKKGVLQMLKQRKVDLSAAFLPILTEYATNISYSPSLDTGEWVVLMKRPEASATGSGLLAPFTLPVWLLILLSLAVVGPIIYLIIYLQSHLCKGDENQVFPLPACIWFVYGALLKQGTTLSPMTDSSRLLFSTWWIFITILTAFYTANLTAFLTLSKFTLPITDADDIGAKKYKWVTTKGNALEDTILNSQGDISDLGMQLGQPEFYLSESDFDILTTYVGKKNWMFIREKPIVEYVMYDDYKDKTRKEIEEPKRCTYVITKFSVTSYSRAFAYARGFKYKPLFDSAIQYLVESGIIKFKLREELPDTEICPLNLGNKERQLRNSDLLMTYEIVGGGFVISAVIFLGELLIRRCYSNGEKSEVKELQKINNNSHVRMGYTLGGGKFVTPPPSYNALFNANNDLKRKNINGREYWVSDKVGETRMIPMRAPSALLFQYTN